MASPEERYVSRYVKYAWQPGDLVSRADIRFADYNPRLMGERERRKLRDIITETGLVSRPVWNKRTGNLVGGHQRISIIDSLEKTKDYWLPCDIIDVDEQAERAINVVLNNPAAQGEFDLEKLKKMFVGPEAIQAKAAAFEPADIYQMFGDDAMEQQPEALVDLADQVRKAKELKEKIAASLKVREQTEYYLVVFASYEERLAFLEKLGLPDNRYVNGRDLSSRLLGEDAN